MSSTKTMLNDQDFGGVIKLINVPDATQTGQPVTFDQLMALRAEVTTGLNWKPCARAAATVNIDLTQGHIPAADFVMGATPLGNYFDSVAILPYDLVLLLNQTDPTENGLYVFGFDGTNYTLVRHSSSNTFDALEMAIVPVSEPVTGGTYGQKMWRQIEVNGNIGDDAITFEQFDLPISVASETVQGVVELASTAEVNANTGGARAVTSDVLNSWDKRYDQETFTTHAGTTPFTITHGLGTDAVRATIYFNSDNSVVDLAYAPTSTSVVTFYPSVAPAANTFKIIISKA